MPYVVIRTNDTAAQKAFSEECGRANLIPVICKLRGKRMDIDADSHAISDDTLRTFLQENPRAIKETIEKAYDEAGRPRSSMRAVGYYSFFTNMEADAARAFASRLADDLDAMMRTIEAGNHPICR